VTTACASTAPTPVTPPDPPAAAAQACRRLAGDLPDQVAGLPRTPTQPESPFTAAWGHGRVVLRCGVARPAGLTPQALLVRVGGVDWYVEDPQAPPPTAGEPTSVIVFVSVGGSTRVEVSVRSRRSAATGHLVDLAPAVRRHVSGSDAQRSPTSLPLSAARRLS